MKRLYKNFDETFYYLNREVLQQPELTIDYVVSSMGFIDNLFIKCATFDCTLNIGEFGYRQNKWTSYTKAMIDKKKVKAFYKELKSTKSNLCVFEFKPKDITKGSGLMCLMFKRHDSRSKWKTCTAIFKSAELQKDFAVDLVFLHVFLRSLPDCVKLDSVNIYIEQAYVSAQYINGYLEYFDLGLEELDLEHPFIKCIKRNREKYFSDKNNLSNYVSLLKMQQVYFKLIELSNIRVLDLELGVEND